MLLFSLLGLLLRLALHVLGFGPALQTTVELVTPLTSWRAFLEGTALAADGLSPYAGGLCHHSPLLLLLARPLAALPPLATAVCFALLDVAVAAVLASTARALLATAAKGDGGAVRARLPDVVAAVYLLHPYGVAASAAHSLAGFGTLATALAVKLAVDGRAIGAAAAVAVAGHLSLYPLVLVVPLAHLVQSAYPGRYLFAQHPVEDRTLRLSTPGSLRALGAMVAWTGVFSVLLLFASFLATGGSWDFVRATYRTTVLVTDLTPNVGLFWYMGMESFAQFRDFFILCFSGHILVYVLPLRIRMRRDPVFLTIVFLVLLATVKSYPTVQDVMLPLALLPLAFRYMAFMRFGFFIAQVAMFCALLRPVFWDMWVVDGTGNPNFFWGTSLSYTLSMVWLVVDLVWAGMSRAHSGERKPREGQAPAGDKKND